MIVRRKPPPSPPATTGTRCAVAVCSAASVAALGAAGLVALPVSLALAVLITLAALAPASWPDPPGAVVRKWAAAGVLLAAVGGALMVTRSLTSATSLADLPGDLGPRLALLATGVLAAQLLLGERLREVLVSLVVAGTTLVLALAAGPGPAVVVPLLVAWPALVTGLWLAHATRQRDRADVTVTSQRPPPGAAAGAGRVAAAVVVSSLVAVLVVLLLPHPQGLHRSFGDRQGESAQGGGGAPGTGEPARSRTAGAYTGGDLDLRSRGTLPDTPVADVPAGTAELWRGSVLDTYNGTSWRSSAGFGPTAPQLAGGPTYALPTTEPDGPLAARVDQVRVREGSTNVLLAPGTPHSLTFDGRVLPLAGHGFFLVPRGFGEFASSYVVTSVPPVLDAATLRAAVGNTAVDGWARALPGALPSRVRTLGEQLVRSAATRYDATLAVQRYLHRHETYRLDSPVPPPGKDAVDHFLFVAHTGFCEQFASAEVVLLRAGGVPARLATGFAAGTNVNGSRTLRAKDAHAWAEVWYPGLGWVSSDPTAGTRLAPPSAPHRLADLLHNLKGRLLLAGLLVAVVGAGWGLLLLGRWVLRRRRARRTVARPPLLAAFGRLEAALARSGAPRALAESLADLGRRPALRPLAGLRHALAVVERYCYAATPPAEAELLAAARVLDESAEQVLEPRMVT